MSDHADTSAEQEPQQYGMIFCHDCQAHHTPGWHKGTAAAHPRISVESQQAEDEPIKDDDWLALMREIAKVSADAEEWEDAALNDFWQFDPWDALRKLQAKAPATGISVEELAQLSKAAATDILSNCAGKFVHPDLWGEDPQLVMDSQIDRAAKTIRAALAALSQPWGER